MNFLKKHYEKVLLGLMLAGLIGVLVFMLFYIASDTESMKEKGQSLVHHKVQPLPPLDTSSEDSALLRSKAAYDLDLESTNKLLNPMEWQKALDGSLILAATRTGPQAAVVTNIAPLYLIISYDSVSTNELGAHYVLLVERQAAPKASERHPTRHYATKGEKEGPHDPFVLLEVKGPPENPDALILKLAGSDEQVTVSPAKPYRGVDGYMADFRYDPEKRAFHSKRVGDKFAFGGAEYLVVEVNKNELVLQDQSNQKKTSLPFAP